MWSDEDHTVVGLDTGDTLPCCQRPDLARGENLVGMRQVINSSDSTQVVQGAIPHGVGGVKHPPKSLRLEATSYRRVPSRDMILLCSLQRPELGVWLPAAPVAWARCRHLTNYRVEMAEKARREGRRP